MKNLLSYASSNIEIILTHTASAGLIAMICSYLQIITTPFFVLIAVMVIEFIAGVYEKKLNSKTAYKGIIKKVSYIALIIVGMGIDYALTLSPSIGISIDTSFYFSLMIILWLIINDLISIVENLGRIGVPLPRKLKAVLEQLKKTVDEKTDGN